MLYYSLADITRSHDLSKEVLMRMVKRGKIKAVKQVRSKDNPSCCKYIIPETELPKLAEFKICDPTASEDAQPDFYPKLWREYERKQKVYEEREARRCKDCKEYWADFAKDFARKFWDEITYYDYLHSEEWREKRRQALKRDGYRCQICGSGINLCVHHISYANLHTDAELDDLVTLCEKCHEEVHSKDFKKKSHRASLFDE